MSDHSWARYLDSMEGIDLTERGDRESAGGTAAIGWGLALAVAVAVLARLVSRAPVWPFTNAAGAHPIDAIAIAIILAMVAANVGGLGERWRPGVSYAGRKLLPFSIMLLGARLDFVEMLGVGGRGLLLGILVVAATFGLFAGLARWWKFSSVEALLLAVGTAICGGTAIVAVATVVKARQAEIAVSVATVTLVGLVAMFVLPVLGMLLAMDAESFGFWVGLVIHQTPQVVAAGFAFDAEAGQVATVVKLARVCLLAPVMVGVGLLWPRWGGGVAVPAARPWWKHIPWFVFGFAGMALLRTLGMLPDVDLAWNTSRVFPPLVLEISLQRLLSGTAAFLLVVAMAGVGLETRLADFRRSSLRAAGAAALTFVVLAALVFMLV